MVLGESLGQVVTLAGGQVLGEVLREGGAVLLEVSRVRRVVVDACDLVAVIGAEQVHHFGAVRVLRELSARTLEGDRVLRS